MPVKVHVKGKRKAPLPPTIKPTAPVASDDAQPSPAASPIENAKKKSPAPQPPPSLPSTSTSSRQLDAMKHLDIVSKIDTNIEPNNLSTVGNKQTDKKYETKTIFNIVEPKHIRNNLRAAAYRMDEPILTKFTSDFVNVYNGNNANNDDADADCGTTEVWNCEHCTLENPFWKIVCAACDRIRPYGLPTRTVPNKRNPIFSGRTNDALPSTSTANEAEVKLRRKASINSNNFDTISSKRSSMDGDIHPYAIGPTPIELMQKIDNNDMNSAKKRTSMIVTKDNDYTMNTLEMEKQRLRAVIRSMNNRALAEKYPIEKPNNIDVAATTHSHKYETLNLNVHAMEKNGEKELNGETALAHDNVRLTDDAKAKAKNHGTRAAKAKPDDTYYDFVGNLATFCDQVPLGGTMRKLEAEIDQEKQKKHNNLNDASNLRYIDETPANDLIINLYVNFNNAIGVDVRRDMTLKELKEYVSRHIVPCRNPKIYFNGLLMQKDQSLAEYGIKERSSLYINTENITVDVDNVHRNLKHSKGEKLATNDGAAAAAAVEPKTILIKETLPLAAATRQFEFPKEDDLQPAKYQIEHIQLNRFTIEKINPQNANITKTKYRGVYNYNPRCNPNVHLAIKAELPHATPAKPKQAAQPSAIEVPVSNEKLPTTTTKVLEEASNHYLELLSLDNLNDIAVNTEAFECAVCFAECEPTEGVVLRNCLHTFCKDCIRNTIIYSEEAEVKCPYNDAKYTCDCTLQDREIKALLTKNQHDEHLAKSLRVAENQIENSFHCRTPNCAGWCIYEDNVNQYKCAICNLVNCLTCRVIHDGLNCAQYQDMLKNNLEGNPENATTKNMLDEMIKNGEAMNCPTCRVVLMKKWGCDWLKCSMCKTEICWVTRGSRWGPAGKGDITGGCKCGVDGFKCHPKCNYCH